MKAVSQCSLCLLKLAHTSADAMGADESLRMKAVNAAISVLDKDDFERIPPAIARDVLDAVNQALGTDDPFAQKKTEHDRKAKKLADEWAPDYMAGTKTDDERLERAIKAAIAGNGMDMATIPEDADPERFKKWLEVPWARYDFGDFKKAVEAAENILYLLNNAGEVAFDRILIQELLDRGKKITAVVKDGPALNDAMAEDALTVGLDKLEGPAGKITLMTTGQRNMGLDLANASPEMRKLFFDADMVIGKGQANLESLHDCGREVFFVTLIKCTHVAVYYGYKKGQAMLYKGGLESGTGPAR